MDYMQKISQIKKILVVNIIIILIFGVIANPVMGEVQDTSNIKVSCKYPGKVIEAGETVIFDLVIKNTATTNYPKKLRVDTFKGEEDWEFRFLTEGGEIDRIAYSGGETDTIQLEVKTTGDTPKDTYPFRFSVDSGKLWLYITIKESHAGENGILKLEVVNEQGDKIKGATVSAFQGKSTSADIVVYSMADGKIRTDLDQGEYRILIEKNGYLSREIDDINIQSGYTEDIDTVMLERKNFGLDVDVKTPVTTSLIGQKPLYEMVLMNVGKSDDLFRLSSKNMPEGWYGRYKETIDSKSELSEIFIKTGEEKTVYFEIIPPYSVIKGDYSFDSVINSTDGMEYITELKAIIKGSSDLQVFSEKYLYEITKGKTAEVPVNILNNGNGVALTNIIVEVSTPEGWKITTSPETIPSIEPGERKTVYLTVVPPSDIAASEYKITTNVISDQEEVSDSLRIVVNESSMIGVFGIILMITAAGSVFYMYRKYERR